MATTPTKENQQNLSNDGDLLLQTTHVKDVFLNNLRSSGRYRYSRYNGLPLRYAGGKSLAVGHVIENMPDKVNHLASPFIGGASVEIACAKELEISVQGYDVFDILTNYWQIQLESPSQLADRISQWNPTKAVYAEVKNRLQAHWRGIKPIKDRMELAAHYWFNHNLSYGPGFLGWMSSIYEDQQRFERLLNKVRNFKCSNLKVSHGEFQQTLSCTATRSSTATRHTTCTATAACSAAYIRNATSQFTMTTSTTPHCATCYTTTKRDSSSHTTIAKPYATGTQTSASLKFNGNTHSGRAKPESARTESKTAPTTMSSNPMNC